MSQCAAKPRLPQRERFGLELGLIAIGLGRRLTDLLACQSTRSQSFGDILAT